MTAARIWGEMRKADSVFSAACRSSKSGCCNGVGPDDIGLGGHRAHQLLAKTVDVVKQKRDVRQHKRVPLTSNVMRMSLSEMDWLVQIFIARLRSAACHIRRLRHESTLSSELSEFDSRHRD